MNEQILTNSQRAQILAESKQSPGVAVIFTQFKKTILTGYKGYKISSALVIGGKTTFSFTATNGNCLISSGANTFSPKFGLNAKISCKCNNCGMPLLFSEIMGKSVPQYFNIPSPFLVLPSITDPAMKTLKINFIIGKYGSQNVKYIEKITYSYETNPSNVPANIRTLHLNFIDSDNLIEQ